MLAAEPEELRGEAETALAAHIAGCADCRRASAMIVGSTTQLGLAIARRSSRTRRRASRRVIGLVLVPIAAVAVFAVLRSLRSHQDDIVKAGRSARRAEPPRVSLSPLPVARTVSLEVGRGQQATVLKTADPKVTVIWLSSGEGK
jgi:hypothetical protein